MLRLILKIVQIVCIVCLSFRTDDALVLIVAAIIGVTAFFEGIITGATENKE